MPQFSALPQEVADALARGWAVVTANQRAARWLRREFDRQQHAAGMASWLPPQVLAWETWLQSLYRQMLWDGRAGGMLLNGWQEHAVWRAVITEDASTSSLRPVDALAEASATAWVLLHAYRGRDQLRRYPGNSDTRVFAAWVAEFERRLKRAQCVTAAQLPQRLSESIVARHVSLPPGVLLTGFDAVTPAQEAVMSAARSVGVEIVRTLQEEPAAMRRLGAAASEREEVSACATWVRTRLRENPAAQIAVILPAIEPMRAEIEREFRAVLAPELNDIAAPVGSAPYEFSLGIALAQRSLVSAALDVLRWSLGPLPLERVTSLLLSPYFAAGRRHDERLARAELDAFVLRRQKLLQPRLGVDALHRMAARSKGSTELVGLLNHLAALRSAFGAPELPLLGTYADWSETMADMLSAAGWATVSDLDSVEFQARRKWESALDELATLDFDDQRVPFAQALESLEYIVSRTLFAPESRGAPIQILGPFEAAGSRFEAVWFLHANDAEWATTASPNPLLPWQLQRDLNMPGTLASEDAELARSITRRIAASCDEAVFSYARESAEGPQRASPALEGLVLERFDASELVEAPRSRPAVAAEVFRVEPGLPAPPDVVLRGGAGVLEKQAACAFRAFAELRLFSTPLDNTVLGFDPMERGSIVHRVLELFWTRIHSQAELRARTVEARNAELDECIRQAIAERARTPEPGWSAAYLDAERQRLRNLLRPWLEYEAQQRSAFEVKAVENKYADVNIGPLRLDVKVDRIDTALVESEPAGEIILDYKTGVANTADWLGERPDAPQLPLYAVVAGVPELAGIAFASVRPGTKRELRGFQSRPNVLPKTPRQGPESLAAQVEQWRADLKALAEEFYSGTTDVRPKSYPMTCRYCHQRLLCRLDVATLSADETEDPDETLIEEEYG